MRLLLSLLFSLAFTAAQAGDSGLIRKEAKAGVSETVDALVGAMKTAGITIFARVDHGAGAKSIGEDIGASQMLLFGSPRVGTPAMLDDPVAGLFLPLKVLVFEDVTGQTMIAYEDPKEMLGKLGGISTRAPYLAAMSGALAKFTDGVAK
ncbi:MAG: DUF302 domain-containing protein [Pseudomonadota bacterium]